MKKFMLAAIGVLSCVAAVATDRQSYTIVVDNEGVMRRSDTGEEMSWYGTNYTLPFAHAYRAMGYLGVDRKKAIDRDVYHLSRLGLNAFRLHLWDAELADDEGNLLANDHLDLLDYLIARLEERGIDVILTAQTNFGNGYPERDIDTGSFTYDFEKCAIHSDPKALRIQENYLRQLARHVNPYTGRSYADDNAIIAMEINNEPCHSGDVRQVKSYINRMVKALRKGGFKKPLLYNVSHNPAVTSAYYDADVQGTTYQWYPTGLVSGHERKGNFLPNVDAYPISWKDSIAGYKNKAKVVYEFDPGDVLVSYLYPAIVRTMRGEGFQWITQFAYDPTDMARFNTEYQTHFLNLAYTPAKALSMLIAAETAQRVGRGETFGTYPDNTSFRGVRVDAEADLAVLNTPELFYYTNTTSEIPVSAGSLRRVAGHGSSPVVRYGGTGAYFLDRLDSLHWRLEVMPDVVLTADPFAKTSLKREVAQIVYASRPLTINIPSLGSDFVFTGVNEGNSRSGRASGGKTSVYPGVYLLSAAEPDTTLWHPEAAWGEGGRMKLGEFVAPEASKGGIALRHIPQAVASGSIRIEARATAPEGIDSLVVYPADVSFWRHDNKLYNMKQSAADPFLWTVNIPADTAARKADYRIVAFSGDKSVTYPSAIPGTPLDWDYPEPDAFYSVVVTTPDAPAILINPNHPSGHAEAAALGDTGHTWLSRRDATTEQPASYGWRHTPGKTGASVVVKDYVAPIVADAPGLHDKKALVLTLGRDTDVESVEVGFITADGRTFLSRVPMSTAESSPQGFIIRVPLENLSPAPTPLLPIAYPFFTAQTFTPAPDTAPLHIHDVESAIVAVPDMKSGVPSSLSIISLSLQ